MHIGLLGHGVVGSGVEKIILQNQTMAIQIDKILVKDDAEKTQANMVLDFKEILEDNQIDTVVECIGGLEPSHSYCLQALNKGKNVVTSNKAMVATFFDELVAAAKANNVKLLFEASVGGGIPWIHNLIKTKRVDLVTGYKGIFNGTTNYILDQMFKNNCEFAQALQQAQKLGYAERDPSNDIDGIDVKYKCCISANVAYDTSCKLDSIDTFGIRNITTADIEYCKNNKLVCKLLGQSSLNKNTKELDIYVQPEFVDDMFAHVTSNYNFIRLYCNTLESSSFMGQGAGSLPTAHAIIQDLCSLKENEQLNYESTNTYSINNTAKRSYYVRTTDTGTFKDVLASQISNTQLLTKPIEVHSMNKLVKQTTDERIFIAGVKND